MENLEATRSIFWYNTNLHDEGGEGGEGGDGKRQNTKNKRNSNAIAWCKFVLLEIIIKLIDCCIYALAVAGACYSEFLFPIS